MFETLKAQFILNFIKDDRWMFMWIGLRTTLLVTVLALLIGTLLGTIFAVIRSMHDQLKPNRRDSAGALLLIVLNTLTKVYLTVIRGAGSGPITDHVLYYLRRIDQ